MGKYLASPGWRRALISGLLALMVVLGLHLDARRVHSMHPRPNVVLIVTDDQRVGTLGVMPRTRYWLVRGGTYFSHAYVTTPLCCPSRSSIFTGLYAHNHHVVQNVYGDRLPQQLTIQHYLQRAGYVTAIFGKYLNYWDVYRAPPYFDRWGIQEPVHVNALFNEQGRVERVPGYSTDHVADDAVEFIRERAAAGDGRPFFLYVAPHVPHAPFRPPERYADAPVPPFRGDPATRELDVSDKPPFVRRLERTHRVEHYQLPPDDRGQLRWDRAQRQRYFTQIIPTQQERMLMAADDLVNRVMSTLHSTGLDRNTLVIYISDNGFLWGEHGLVSKSWPYTQSVQVPMMMRWPGHVPAGAVDDRLVANIDIAPTIAQATGVQIDAPMDGHSLLDRRFRRSALLLEHWSPTWASLITPGYQYVEYYHDWGLRHMTFREYYDLRRDPWELHDLLSGIATSQGLPLERLHQQLREYEGCRAFTCP